MIYRKQTRDACLAYSLLQLGRVSVRAVKEYERILKLASPNFNHISPWLDKHAPELKEQWGKVIGFPLPTNGVPIPEDRGIIFVMGETKHSRTFHAISYEKGVVMDPAEDAPGVAETWTEFSNRWRSGGIETMAISAFPIKG